MWSSPAEPRPSRIPAATPSPATDPSVDPTLDPYLARLPFLASLISAPPPGPADANGKTRQCGIRLPDGRPEGAGVGAEWWPRRFLRTGCSPKAGGRRAPLGTVGCGGNSGDIPNLAREGSPASHGCAPRAPQATLTDACLRPRFHAPASIPSLQEYYYNMCTEKSQRINPFVLHILQEVDEEYKKGLQKGITLTMAGNNRLIPVERLMGEDFWILSKMLKKNPYITGLDVRYNLISNSGAYYAAKLLQKPLNLIYLNLMFNDIGSSGGELIAKALHKNTILKYLRMTGNKIENKGGMFFAAMLQINSSLEKLDLGDCDLGMQGVIAFATVLTQNQAIKGINLNRPILYGEQEESTVHMGHMLKQNNFLVELHMCKHDMKNDGLKHLCDALYLNTSLRYLDVSCNRITYDGIYFLAKVLKSNTTLEVLDLSFNRIENTGAKYLSETLTSHNRSLKALVWFYI
ncbi:leucine-rich repeat-containing protein 34 [Rhynchocyon petersi]